MTKADCLPCRLGDTHTFHDSGDPNLAYAYEGTEPPVQDSYQASCNVAECSGDHDFEHERLSTEEFVEALDRNRQHRCEDCGVELAREWPKPVCIPCSYERKKDQAPLDLMQQAEDLVYGDRQSSYGHPYDDYSRTAGMWSAFLGVDITPAQAALMMVLLKVSRERNRPKDDNIVDAHGYLLCYGRIQGRDQRA